MVASIARETDNSQIDRLEDWPIHRNNCGGDVSTFSYFLFRLLISASGKCDRLSIHLEFRKVACVSNGKYLCNEMSVEIMISLYKLIGKRPHNVPTILLPCWNWWCFYFWTVHCIFWKIQMGTRYACFADDVKAMSDSHYTGDGNISKEFDVKSSVRRPKTYNQHCLDGCRYVASSYRRRFFDVNEIEMKK